MPTLGRLCLKYWPWLVGGVVLGLVSGYVYAKFQISIYAAQSSIVVNGKTGSASGTVGSQDGIGDDMIKTYEQLLADQGPGGAGGQGPAPGGQSQLPARGCAGADVRGFCDGNVGGEHEHSHPPVDAVDRYLGGTPRSEHRADARQSTGARGRRAISRSTFRQRQPSSPITCKRKSTGFARS